MASLFNILSTGNKDRTGNVVEININEIQPSRYQPRLEFDEEAIKEANRLLQIKFVY